MGCWKEKEQKTTADFRIVEYGTNQPIENARIILKRCTSEFLGGTYCDNVDTLYTNAQGRFALSIPQTPDTYQFSIDAANYFDYEGNDYLLQVNQHNTGDLALYPHAWLKVHIKNVNPFDVFDRIKFGWESGEIYYYGQELDTLFTYKLVGNQDFRATWWVFKNNQSSFFVDTLYLPGHDTTFYEILY